MAHSKTNLRVCIDANIFFSAFGFGGKPGKVIQLALDRQFDLVLGASILQEAKRNLTGKLDFSPEEVNSFFDKLIAIGECYVPEGNIEYITHKADNLVLETAIMCAVDVLVTGDKKHLLPLKVFRGVVIEPPHVFLERFNI